VSRSSLENCPAHLEHLSQGRYRKVAAFWYLFKTTALQKLLLLRFKPHLTLQRGAAIEPLAVAAPSSS